jgi:hypothetical protein
MLLIQEGDLAEACTIPQLPRAANRTTVKSFRNAGPASPDTYVAIPSLREGLITFTDITAGNDIQPYPEFDARLRFPHQLPLQPSAVWLTR